MRAIPTLLLIFLVALSGPVLGQGNPEGQEPAPAEPAPAGGEVIQTPFGPRVREGQGPAPVPEVTPPPEPPPADPAVAAEPEPEPIQATDDALAGIELQLDNADIYQVIRIIGDSLGLNYIIDPAVRGTVNISTSSSLLRSDLLPILETLLRINGATMVRTGNFYQIVPSSEAIRQALPVQDEIVTDVPDDQIVLQIVRMRYVPASEMVQLLNPYLSEGGNIVVHNAGNILLITERRSNLRKLLDIVDIFDSNVFENERVRLFPVQNALASELINDLDSIFSGYAFSDMAAVQFIPIQRLNAVLAITANEEIFSNVEEWMARLDRATDSVGIRNYVYKVQNSKAEDIQNVLSQLYGQASTTDAALGTQSVATAAGVQQGVTGEVASSAATGAPQAIYADGIRIIADPITNSLVIQTTPDRYAEIERTIEELDVLPRQVLIDAQIYEVNLDDSLALGLSATLQNRGTLNPAITTASFASGGSGPPSLSAQTFAFVGRTRELVAFLNASENRSRIRTLSAPSVLVSDNMVAQFQVGAEVPIPTTSSVTPVQSDGTNLFAQTISFRTTGVLLDVRPQINDSGRVTLEITQEVSQAGSNATSAIVAPVIGKSAVSSTIVVQDGETIALGGFIRESNELSRSRLPVLGRIPGLGVLFGSTLRAETRSELVILITPHVIRNSEDGREASEELKAKLDEIERMMQ